MCDNQHKEEDDQMTINNITDFLDYLSNTYKDKKLLQDFFQKKASKIREELFNFFKLSLNSEAAEQIVHKLENDLNVNIFLKILLEKILAHWSEMDETEREVANDEETFTSSFYYHKLLKPILLDIDLNLLCNITCEMLQKFKENNSEKISNGETIDK